jgi:acetylornithine deacetylase/succinyl-diaminopimelate desuccinylase-like protein
MPDFTPHQQKIIQRYYQNQENLGRQRLAELVSELYLAQGKKRLRVWELIINALTKVGVPQTRIDYLRAQDKPELLAEIVKDLEGK